MKKTLPFLLIIILLFTGCAPKSEKKITIGAKKFTEQFILGEILSALVEKDTDLKVERKLNLGGTFICFNAMKSGDVDAYVEYTGTAMTAILGKEAKTDPDEVYKIVKDDFKKNYNIVWLDPLGFNNSYTLTMRREDAESQKVEKISDLARIKDQIQAAFDHEFLSRPDGYEGLVKFYGFQFKNNPQELDPGLMYMAIKEKKVNLICGYTTDGRISAFNLKILKDDKHFFPPYYAAPVIRQATLDKYPQLVGVLNKLAGKITEKEMMEMNNEVDVQKKDPKVVAEEFLKKSSINK